MTTSIPSDASQAAPPLSKLTPEFLKRLKGAADWSGHVAVNEAYDMLAAIAQDRAARTQGSGEADEMVKHLRNAWATLHNLSADMEASPIRQQMQRRAVEIRTFLDRLEQPDGTYAPTTPQAAEVPGFVPEGPVTLPDALHSLRAEALEVFDGPETSQDVRDVIEWYTASIGLVVARARTKVDAAIAAAPTPTASAAKAEGEMLRDAIADHIADNWSMRRYELSDIVDLIRAIDVPQLAATQPPSSADQTREGGNAAPYCPGCSTSSQCKAAGNCLDGAPGPLTLQEADEEDALDNFEIDGMGE